MDRSVTTHPGDTGTLALSVVAATATITTVTVMPVFLVGGLAVQINGELHFSPAGLGLAVSLYFAGSALNSLLAGQLVERFGARLTSRCGVLLAVFSMLGVALAHSYVVLVMILVACAGANTLGQLSSNLILAQHIPRHRQGLSFGVKQAATPMATLIAGAAVPTIGLTVGWRWAFVLTAALGLLALALVPQDDPRRSLLVTSGKAERATGPLIVLAGAAGLAAASAYALGIFLVDSSVRGGLDPALAGAMLTLGSVIGLGARLLGGWLADRCSGRHIIGLAFTLAVGGLGIALLAVPNVSALVIGTVLGYGLGWSWPGVLTFIVVQLKPAAPTAATSVIQFGIYAGGFIGPIVFGTLAANWSYSLAWLTAAIAMLVASGLMLVAQWLLSLDPHPSSVLALPPDPTGG
jgi:MFS family permease